MPNPESTRKTSTESVNKLRERRARLGVHRMEIYVHPDDMKTVLKTVHRVNRARYGRASP